MPDLHSNWVLLKNPNFAKTFQLALKIGASHFVDLCVCGFLSGVSDQVLGNQRNATMYLVSSIRELENLGLLEEKEKNG